VKRAAIILASAVLATSSALVFGCELAPGPVPPICERFWEGDAVALANVASIQKTGYKRLVTLRIAEVFRGDPPTEVIFEDPETDCGVSFESLGTELVWLYKEKDKWKAYIDRRADRAADLAFARSMKNPPSVARVFGSVGRANPKMIVMGGPPSMVEPLPGVLVAATGPSGHYEIAVDQNGNFELSSLSPGQYNITVEGLAPNLDDEPVSVVLSGGQCKEIHFRPDTSGEISGRLLPDGKTPSPAWVVLFAAHDAPKRADSDEHGHEVARLFADDETGKFVFRHVRPGRYVVAFQPGDPPDMDVPYWPRFYRSAQDRKNAETIEIAEGQKITDLEFPIGDKVARRKVFVRAIWQDGTVAENVHLQLRNSKNSSNLTHQDVYTDSKGEGVLEAFLSISYQLESHATCEEMWQIPLNLPFPVRPSHQAREVKDVVIPASAANGHVSVIVKGPKCTLIPKFGVSEDE
jgi:hypothetical protein